jgi:1,4-dihydroxy-2-naphthoate octaprenyltransferase
MEDGRGVDRPSLYVPTMKKLMTHRWSRALRWPFLTGSLVPVFAGTGYAWMRTHLMFGLFLCAGLIVGFWS